MHARELSGKQHWLIAGCVAVATCLFALPVCDAEEPDGKSPASEPTADSPGLYLYRSLIYDFAFSPDGKTVVTGSYDETARLWDVATGEPRGRPMRHEQRVVTVAFSPDGKTVLTGGEDSTARLWDTSTGKPRGKVMKHDHHVQDVAFSPDGKTVLTCSYDTTARLWDAATGHPRGEPIRHKDFVWAVAYSPDGTLFLTGCSDNTARLWDAATGKSRRIVLPHKERVTAVAFSPDGKTILTGSDDNTARLWDTVTGKRRGRTMEHGYSDVRDVAFSPDGKFVITGCDDNIARRWDAATGEPRGKIATNLGYAMAISPDGKTIVTAGSHVGWSEVRLWDATIGQPLPGFGPCELRPGQARLAEPDPIVPGCWDIESRRNIKWSAKLGGAPYKSPPPHAARAANTAACIAGGKVFIGTSNAEWIKDYGRHHMGTLLCFDEESGKFLWQHSNPALDSVHDQFMGVASIPHVEGDRLWYVNNRSEVVCLDTEGFRDDENDGPYREESAKNHNEADVVWKFDMIKRLGVFPCRISACTPTFSGNLMFVNTSNGRHEIYYEKVKTRSPSPKAPCFVCLDKRTGRVVWTDNSVGANYLRGSWSSPTYAVLGNVPQVLFPGGDGWLYSFAPQGDGQGKSKLLWKFDCNPKTSTWPNGRRGHFIAPAVTRNDRVYIPLSRDLEGSLGAGHLWCIDPTKRGDVSPELVFNRNAADPQKPIPHKRIQACEADKGDYVRPNPNSAVVWHYQGADLDGDGKLGWQETFHLCNSRFAIKDGLLVIADGDGLLHCIDAQTGKPLWTYEMEGGLSPVVIFGKYIYACSFSVINVFRLSRDPKVAMHNGGPLRKLSIGGAIYGLPVLHKNVLYVPTTLPGKLFAIAEDANADQPGRRKAGKSPNRVD